MNRVLYEASFQFHPFLLIPIFMMVYIVMEPFILKQKNKLNDNKYHNNYKLNKRSRMIGLAFLAITSLEVLLGQIYMYNKIVSAYKQGKYQIVEGYVFFNSAEGNKIVYIEELD